jgi:hypothetical protein
MKTIVQNSDVYDLPYVVEPPDVSCVDLRSLPIKIDEIPELKKEPLLTPLIMVLNDPHGQFMTLGCAVGTARPQTDGVVIPVPQHAETALCWYTTYVSFSFWLLDQNKVGHYMEIYQNYPSDRTDANICFELVPAYFCTPHEQERGITIGGGNGMICLLWISGWGATTVEAHDKWLASIQDAITFFTNLQKVTDPPSGITVVHVCFQIKPRILSLQGIARRS